MYGYIYETTNIKDNTKYIGQHKSSEFDKNYYGSGLLLQRAISKYGKENFTVKVIKWCKSRTELNEMEKYYIKLLKESNNESYNIAAGGEGGNNRFGEMTEEHKRKISSSLSGKKFSEERKRNISNGRKGIKSTITPKWEMYLNSIRGKSRQISEYQRNAIIKAVSGPKKEETIKKLSEANKGKIYINNGVINRWVRPEVLQEELSKGWKIGTVKR